MAYEVKRDSSSNFESWSDMLPVLQEFAELLQKNIYCSNPHGSSASPQTKGGALYIKFWSSTKGERGSDTRKAFGIPLESAQSNDVLPTGDGLPIADPEGQIVGEVVEGTLYVLFDLPHGFNAGKLMRAILEQYAFFQKSLEEREQMLSELAARRRKASREAYIRECSARFNRTVNETRKKIDEGHKEVQRLQAALVKKLRETQGAERKLEQLESCRGGELDKYGLEFDRLLSVPKVIDVVAGDGVVKVFTETLYCVDPRSQTRHEIGKFRIELYTNGANGGVRWFNTTRRVGGYKSDQMAPHIWSDGSACLGNVQEIFPELIGQYEFAAAAMLAIQFVESVNTDDSAGQLIDRWPVAAVGD